MRTIDKILKSKKASLKQIKTKLEYEKYVNSLKVTVEQRLIMQMVFVEGHHYNFIADKLGYSESAIKHKVRKILEQL